MKHDIRAPLGRGMLDVRRNSLAKHQAWTALRKKTSRRNGEVLGMIGIFSVSSVCVIIASIDYFVFDAVNSRDGNEIRRLVIRTHAVRIISSAWS